MIHVTVRTIALCSTLAVVVAGCVLEGDAVDPFEHATARNNGGGRPVTLIRDPEGGVWVNNGLHDPDVSGIDPDHSLASPQGLEAVRAESRERERPG